MPDPQSSELLEAQVRGQAVRVHAEMARMAELLAAFSDCDGWRGVGMRSCADWLSVHCGFDRYTAGALARAGESVRELPAVGEAFSAGDLSLDQVRSLSTVAKPDDLEDQGGWLRVARDSSPAELAQLCRESRNSEKIDAPERARAQQAQRGLRTWWDEFGMLRMSGALPSDAGAMVRITLEKVGRRLATERSARPVELDPADDPLAALRADALVMVCHAALGGQEAAADPQVQLVVHVDAELLAGESREGRCHLEDGPAVSTAVLERLGCDCSVVSLTERDGLPIDSGRSRRVVPAGKRRAVQSRDRVCRFPGCAVPATRTQAHHIAHWFYGGPTRVWNLLALCGHHHRRHHQDEFDIRRTPEGDLRFETMEGRLIGIAGGGAWKPPRTRAGPR